MKKILLLVCILSLTSCYKARFEDGSKQNVFTPDYKKGQKVFIDSKYRVFEEYTKN